MKDDSLDHYKESIHNLRSSRQARKYVWVKYMFISHFQKELFGWGGRKRACCFHLCFTAGFTQALTIAYWIEILLFFNRKKFSRSLVAPEIASRWKMITGSWRDSTVELFGVSQRLNLGMMIIWIIWGSCGQADVKSILWGRAWSQEASWAV